MSKETLEYVVAKAKELIAAPSCSAEAKEADHFGIIVKCVGKKSSSLQRRLWMRDGTTRHILENLDYWDQEPVGIVL